MAHDGEHHQVNTEPPGLKDIFIGAVAFYLLTLLVNYLVTSIDPNLISRSALIEIQLSGLLFLFVWWLIGNGIFKPFFEAAIEREESTSGAQRKAQELRRSLLDVDEQIQQELGKARLVGIQQRDAKVEVAKRKAQEKLDAAQQQNDKDLQAAAKRLEELRGQAERELAAEAEKLAEVVAERALAAESGSQSIH